MFLVRHVCWVLLPLLLAVTCATAQEERLQLRAGPVYTSADGQGQPKFPKVDIVLDVVGSQTQKYAAGDLSLIEEGVATNEATEVRSFEECGYGLGAIVAIDASGSMKGAPLDAIRHSLYRFSNQVRPADRVGVLTFADDSRWDVPSGSTPAELRDRLENVRARGHYTRLYDGLLDAMAGLDDSFPVRRELMVISDGHDEGSRHSERDVIEEANRRGIAIDAVGVTRSKEKYLQSLKNIAAQTGGIYQRAKSDQDLENLVAAGLTHLKASPVATFVVARLHPDGQKHKVAVHWSSTASGIDLTAETTFSTPLLAAGGSAPAGVPATAPQPKGLRTWLWGAGGAVLFVILISGALLLRRKKKRENVVAEAAQQVFPVPVTSETIAPVESAQVSNATHSNATHSAPRPAEPLPAKQPSEAENEGSPRRSTRMLQLFDQTTDDGVVAWLDGIGGNYQGKRFPIKGPEFWIGAAANNDLRIDDATVSGNHAFIRLEDSVLIIGDNNSTNGTRINDIELRGTRRSLNPGDVIQMGRIKFRLTKEAFRHARQR